MDKELILDTLNEQRHESIHLLEKFIKNIKPGTVLDLPLDKYTVVQEDINRAHKTLLNLVKPWDEADVEHYTTIDLYEDVTSNVVKGDFTNGTTNKQEPT